MRARVFGLGIGTFVPGRRTAPEKQDPGSKAMLR